jgi:hypothetical protein
MNPNGMWRGRVNGREGTFKFIHVKLLDKPQEKLSQRRETGPKDGATLSLEVNMVLREAGLSHLAPLLILNGYDTAEELVTITSSDLEYLGVSEEEHRKICAALAALTLRASNTAKHARDIAGLSLEQPHDSEILLPCPSKLDNISSAFNDKQSERSSRSIRKLHIQSQINRISATPKCQSQSTSTSAIRNCPSEATNRSSATANCQSHSTSAGATRNCPLEATNRSNAGSNHQYLPITLRATSYCQSPPIRLSAISNRQSKSNSGSQVSFGCQSESSKRADGSAKENTTDLSLRDKEEESSENRKNQMNLKGWEWRESFLYTHVKQSQLNTVIIPL